MKKQQPLQVGDHVKVTDFSYIERVDCFQPKPAYDQKHKFKIMAIKPEYTHDDLTSIDGPVHNVYIQDRGNYRIYLHSLRFLEPIKQVNPKLLEALRKSIQQWKVMLSTGKSKQEVYRFLGGKNNTSWHCFLCDTIRKSPYSYVGCENCIDWGASECNNPGSPFYMWQCHPNPDNTQAMLSHLQRELERLESLSK